MREINLSKNFPSEATMLSVLKKTIEQSWKTDLDIEDIENWLSNYTGRFFEVQVERRIALWMLCNFTYYNEEEVNHLCRMLFKKLVHRLLIDNGLTNENDAEDCINHTVFTCIGNASESGGLLLYHFRQENSLDLDRFIFPTDILETNSDAIVCIDDVMISGETACGFFYAHKEKLSSKKLYYISLIATEDAIKRLEDLGITVICCAKLDSRYQLFRDSSLAFYKYPEEKNYAKEMAEGYGMILESEMPLGYKDGQYCFGLFYNVPNNSLPIFWSTRNNWTPIFLRKEKYRNAKQAKRKYSYFI